MFFISISREACLRLFSYALVIVLHKKSGNFLDIFKTLFSKSIKIKMRAYIKYLRHASLVMDMKSHHTKFQSNIWFGY